MLAMMRRGIGDKLLVNSWATAGRVDLNRRTISTQCPACAQLVWRRPPLSGAAAIGVFLQRPARDRPGSQSLQRAALAVASVLASSFTHRAPLVYCSRTLWRNP